MAINRICRGCNTNNAARATVVSHFDFTPAYAPPGSLLLIHKNPGDKVWTDEVAFDGPNSYSRALALGAITAD